MTPSISLIISACLTLIMLMVASLARARAWTPEGFKIALGNRDDVPQPSPFAALLTAAGWADVPDAELLKPCALFVYGRLVYAPLYWAGIKYLRTVAWAVSIGGLIRIALTML